MPSLRTSDLAVAVGVHPNTVRLYEEWGYLPPIPRSSSGYRLFTPQHLEQMRLARLVLGSPWPGRIIRRSGLDMVKRAAQGELDSALTLAHQHQAMVLAERDQAEAAVDFLDLWAQGRTPSETVHSLRIGQAARLLDLSIDQLRNWERNGLVKVPRDLASGYRRYGPPEIGRLRVIRVLRLAGYSMMSILRMLNYLDQGGQGDLRRVLDTPPPDDDIVYVTDRWLSTLAELEQTADRVIAQIEKMRTL